MKLSPESFAAIQSQAADVISRLLAGKPLTDEAETVEDHRIRETARRVATDMIRLGVRVSSRSSADDEPLVAEDQPHLNSAKPDSPTDEPSAGVSHATAWPVDSDGPSFIVSSSGQSPTAHRSGHSTMGFARRPDTSNLVKGCAPPPHGYTGAHATDHVVYRSMG